MSSSRRSCVTTGRGETSIDGGQAGGKERGKGGEVGEAGNNLRSAAGDDMHGLCRLKKGHAREAGF